MKRASFTLFQPQRWMSKLGQSALMVLFALCMSLQTASAQELVKMPSDSSSVVKTITKCNGETTSTSPFQFTDDGANDGNYSDVDTRQGTTAQGVRTDTTTFCPQDAWHAVTVTFTDINLAPGDILTVHDGHRDSLRKGLAVPLVGRTNAAGVNGVGESDLTGSNGNGAATGTYTANEGAGWVTANCDQAFNPNGCLTFVFTTNNNNSKGKGWDAWVDCAERSHKFKDGSSDLNIPSANLTCSQYVASLTIPVPEITGCTTVADRANNVRARIKNQQGETCFDQLVNDNTNLAAMNFAIGTYTVEYVSQADTTKRSGPHVFTVQAPSLICNDNVTIPLGSACLLQITPDDILENPCDTADLPLNSNLMYYNITITFGSGKDKQTLTTTGHDTGAPVVYPTIKVADLTKAGMSVCSATAEVTIERIYYGRGMPVAPFTIPDCHNGPQNASCSTTIAFSDQSKPFITLTLANDTLVACDTTGMDALLGPKAIDNCDSKVDVTYKVTMEESDPCFANGGQPDTTRAFLVFTAVDDCGNVGTLNDTFTIIRPNLEEHHADARQPKARDCKEGDNDSETPGLKIGVLKNGVLDVADTIHLNTTDYICGYILTKRDVEIPATDCGRKIYRYWSVVNWCEPGTGPSAIDTTFIEYTDEKAPEFANETTDTFMTDFGRRFATFKAVDIELGPFDCTYDINKFTKPSATDNCDAAPGVRIDSIFRIEDGKHWAVKHTDFAKLDCDSFRIKWLASDQCHEQLKNDTVYQVIEIKDVTNPSAICTDQLNVSVPSDEGARIKWEDIDAGSYDACGIEKIEIRRRGAGDDAWAATVDVVCSDVHGGLQIEMRVTDKKGNTNICWMDVTAEDKIPPVCENLPDVSKTCDEYHTGELGAATGGEFVELTGDLLATYNKQFGNPVCKDNLTCGILEIKQYYKLAELNCGALAIERKWKASDWRPNSSNEGTQKITVAYKPSWKLQFPADVDLTCGDAFPAAATTDDIISNGTCDLWALEVTEKTFEVPGDICMKVERTYELINWCVYNAGDAPTVIANNPKGEAMVASEGNEKVGRIIYTQVLKLYVNEAPTITLAPVETCIVGVGDVAPFGEADNTPGAAPYECDTLRTFSATATNCAGVALGGDAFTWKFYVNGSLADEGTGSEFTKVVSPKTKYKIEFWGTDGCGNSAGDDFEVEFWDCKKPTPYVLNGLAVEIMQTGSIDLWASDLDQGSYDNCTSKDKLDIRIALGDPTQGPQDLAGVKALSKNVTLTCDNLGTQSVSIYVIDEEDNWDVVGTYVLVQNNMDACGGDPVDDMGRVAGKITNALGENVELVNVAVNGGDNTMATGADGTFGFSLALDGDYTITPEKNINPLNGVSTYDLVLISKHILGITTFDTPYKYIAADVNKSGSITAFDMVQLRQLILNITSEFPNNTSWRFVDAKHEFTSENPAAENFDEFMSINNLEGAMVDVNFIGTKIGDVNGNATANSLLGAETRSTNGTLSLNATDRFVEAGQTVTVDFTSADIAATQGYQFTMNFAGLDLVSVNEGVAKAANFNTSLANRGVITTSWNGEATANEVLFSMTLTANTNGLLSELVSVNSDVTVAEAYNTAGELLDVNLNFNTSAVSAGFELSQNTPNPFNGETLIGFNLPKAGKATLKVMDIQGKVVSVIEKDGNKGYNQVTINAKTLNATGVLYYQLESADNIATKKMIIIE